MSLYDPFTSTLDRVDALIIFSSYDSHYNKNTSKTRNYQTAWQTFEYKIYTNVIIRNHCIKLMAELHFHTLNCFDVYVQHKLRARTEIRVIPDVNLITDFFFLLNVFTNEKNVHPDLSLRVAVPYLAERLMKYSRLLFLHASNFISPSVSQRNEKKIVNNDREENKGITKLIWLVGNKRIRGERRGREKRDTVTPSFLFVLLSQSLSVCLFSSFVVSFQIHFFPTFSDWWKRPVTSTSLFVSAISRHLWTLFNYYAKFNSGITY